MRFRVKTCSVPTVRVGHGNDSKTAQRPDRNDVAELVNGKRKQVTPFLASDYRTDERHRVAGQFPTRLTNSKHACTEGKMSSIVGLGRRPSLNASISSTASP